MDSRQRTVWIRSEAEPQSGEVAASYSEIEAWLKSTSPAQIEDAGFGFDHGASVLELVTGAMLTNASKLAGAWGGPAAVETQRALRMLHTTGSELAAKMRQVSHVLRMYGGVHLPEARKRMEQLEAARPKDEEPSDAQRTQQARSVLSTLNDQIVGLYHQVPENFSYALPVAETQGPGGYTPTDYSSVGQPTGSHYGSGTSGQNGYTGTGGGDSSGGQGGRGGQGVNDLGLVSTDPSGANPGGFDPNGLNTGGLGPGSVDGHLPGQDGAGTGGHNGLNPASLNPGSVNGLDPTGLSGSDVGKTSLAGLNDQTAFGTGTQGPLNVVGNNGLGNNGLSYGNLPGNGASGTGLPTGAGGFGAGGFGAAGAGAVRAGALGASPIMPFVPPSAGGAGEEKQERESSSKHPEDDEVWGSGGETTPPMIV
ncbi:hypothetical protein AB0395_17240 [Streptosporangium sp. NPDC051023]|uniref:WXG100 family type VII secretion target n=1 Tax=Streptosporangium sp. NPDC051023 TaxID=3155410 RepID=UPI00344B1CCE